MALVPGSLHIDIFVTNIPKDPKPMPPAGTDPEKRKSNSLPGAKQQPHPWTPKYPTTLNPPRISLPSTSMEDVPLGSKSSFPMYLAPPEEKGRRNASVISISDDYNTLLMPNPHDGPSSRRYGDGGLEGKDHDYELGLGGLGHFQEDSTYDVLDYTHFNGDLDAEVAPEEESLSRQLRKEGAARRRKTRKRAMGYRSQNASWVDLGDQVPSPTVVGPEESLPTSPDHGHERGRDNSNPLALDTTEAVLTGKEARRSSVPPYLHPYEFGQRDPNQPKDKKMDRASMNSIRGSVVDLTAVQELMPKTGEGARGEKMEFQASEEELEDVLAMTEYAFPGRPMLDKLLKEEVEMAKGATVVACGCFLSSLSVVLILTDFPSVFHRLRPDIVERLNEEARRCADRPRQDQEGRPERVHLVRHGRVRVLDEQNSIVGFLFPVYHCMPRYNRVTIRWIYVVCTDGLAFTGPPRIHSGMY